MEITTELPKSLLENLEKGKAVIRKECKVWIVELISEESQTLFREFLESADDEVDPVVQVTSWGPMLNPYITPQAQVEVWGIISSYEPLMRDAFLPGAPPINWIPIAAPPAGGLQFHHSKISLQKFQEEIEHPNLLIEHTPALASLNDARPICEISIVYANCIVVRRLHRRT